MEFSYKTIQTAIVDILIKEKGSKFIGYALPVTSEGEVKISLDRIKSIHPKATHHCYAYRLGLQGNLYRINDDGEPSGTAGLPIYNQLLAHDLTDVLLIIVRYYGGTKLGVSGLIKAYKESSKQTLEASKIVEKEVMRKITVSFNFDDQNTAFTLLNRYEASVENFESGQQCTLTAIIKERDFESFLQSAQNFPSIKVQNG